MLASITGCGDNSATCDDRWESYVDECRCCYAAQIFAARDATALTPLAIDVQRYFERWRRAVDREPILRGRTPQTYRDTPPEFIQVNTINELVIDAWAQQHVKTTDPKIDDAISRLGTVTIQPRNATDPAPGAPWSFEVHETSVYSEDALNNALNHSAAWLNDAMPAARDDGTWMWISGPSGTAQIDFTFGWGDCFVACDGFHSLRAVVPAFGEATVYDLGGDPLPPNLHLDPRTMPLP